MNKTARDIRVGLLRSWVEKLGVAGPIKAPTLKPVAPLTPSNPTPKMPTPTNLKPPTVDAGAITENSAKRLRPPDQFVS